MDKGSGLLTYNSTTHLKAQPRLRLLIEWESPRELSIWRDDTTHVEAQVVLPVRPEPRRQAGARETAQQ